MTDIVFDVEANGLLLPWEDGVADKIHVIGWNDIDGDIDRSSRAEDFIGYVRDGDSIIGHNIIEYDLPLMKKLQGVDYTMTPSSLAGRRVRFIDTLLLSKLLCPDRTLPKGFAKYWAENYQGQRVPGPHSLAAWAYRLKCQGKVFIEDWENLSYEEYSERVVQDVEITKALYQHLLQEAKDSGRDLRAAYQTELLCQHYKFKQVEHGVLFDQELARKNVKFLDAEMTKLEEEVNKLLPERTVISKKTYNPPKVRFKKSGEPSAHMIKFLSRMDCEVIKRGTQWVAIHDPFKGAMPALCKALGGVICLHEGDFAPIVAEESLKERMTISNQKDIKGWLMGELGWQPLYWNTNDKKEKTSPKFHEKNNICPGLQALGPKFPVIDKIILWLSYRNRRSVILSKDGTGGLLNHPRLKIDGRVSSEADTMGTATYRFTHKKIANIPRPSSTFGHEMRAMFRVPEGKKLVGWDASSLEDRIKSHYIYPFPGGPEMAAKLLDPEYSAHDENVKAWGLPKPICKNGHYALQYFSRVEGFSKTLGISLEEATPFFNEWWDRHEPLAMFRDQLEFFWKNEGNKKWVPGIDGRRILTRSKHSIVNYVFQSAGIIVMKRAMVIWHREIERLGLYEKARQVIHYHDEAQAETDPDIADLVGQVGCWSIEEAGRSLNLRVPLGGEYKVGMTWSDTH